MSGEVKPFRIAVGDDVLDDLKSRLRKTRWPEAAPVDDWSQGVPLGWIEEVCRYWASDYDWRAREARLNRFPQFTTEIDGLDIHFLHMRSPHAGALPLIITHGWPGSIVEFQKVIEPLADPVNVRRRSRRRLRRGLPVPARLRLLGEAHDHRLGHRSHRRRLGQADGSPGLRALRGAGRRLGLRGDHGSGRARTRSTAPASTSRSPCRRGRRWPRADAGRGPGAKGIKYYADWDSGYSKSNRPGRRPWAMA